MSSPKSRIDIDPKNSMKQNVITHLTNYYFDSEATLDEPQDLTDEVFGFFIRTIEKRITELRKELQYCTPEEYWQIQGAISELKNLIKKLQSG